MPLYDFRCETCGDFEVLRSLADFETPVLCATCQLPAKRLISAPNVNLNSRGLSLRRPELKDPQIVQRDREPKPSRNKVTHGRPWMINH